jgi:hypothetical protein
MAKTWVILVGHAAQALPMNVDDNLVLAFDSNYRFCVTSGNANDFNPPLPSGQDFNAGDIWPTNGNVAVAQTSGTIGWDHQNQGTNCGSSLRQIGGHSIIIS